MSTLLAPVRDPSVPTITTEQIALIKSTIAHGANDTELQLFFYDCQRQGVHPLDKLIHFTKRGGKYTPIASIDFMRQRAAQTGECGGIDDAVFRGDPKTAGFVATVTVYRLVQGQRCAFTASARWPEYKPDQNDFMWQRMPHTMLGKCAEAAALRKGFPQQLAGLYAKEEFDQADGRPAESPRSVSLETKDRTATPHPEPPRQVTPAPAPAPADEMISNAQRRKLFQVAREQGWSDSDVKVWLIAQGIGSTSKIQRADFDSVLQMLRAAGEPLLARAPVADR